jgi:transposase
MTSINPAKITRRRDAGTASVGAADAVRADIACRESCQRRGGAEVVYILAAPASIAWRIRGYVPQRHTHTFILNGKPVSVDCADDVRLLWILRDLLGVTGPKYGCGLGDLDQIRNVCRCGTYPRIRQAIEAGAAKM